jgi:hypothetical protein
VKTTLNPTTNAVIAPRLNFDISHLAFVTGATFWLLSSSCARFRLSERGLCADGSRDPEAHRARAAGGDKGTRDRRPEILHRPHLMLPGTSR